MPIDEIEELKISFVKNLSPLRIYLFGSFAEGWETEESDFDFYIVVSDSEKDMLALTAMAYKAIRHKRSRPVDIIVNTDETFENMKTGAGSLGGEVAEKGILLYEACPEPSETADYVLLQK